LPVVNCLIGMRLLFLLFFSPFGFTYIAQSDMLNVGVGNTIYNHSFLDQNNTYNGSNFSFGEGVSLSLYNLPIETSMNKDNLFSGTNAGIVELNFAIPKKVTFEDSVIMKRGGFVFRMHYYGKQFFYMSDGFVLNATGGFSFGTTRFFGDKRLNQRNPFIKIELGLQPRVFVGDFAFSFSAFYGVDISSGRWKKSSFLNKEEQIQLPKYKQGGLETKFSVGYKF